MSAAPRSSYDVLVLGGGFFGLYVAEWLRSRFTDVLVCEKGARFMARASYANQARVHNGYHYPRSILTAVRSRINYPRFVSEFADCVDRSFTKVYAVARNASKVSASQFALFMRRVGASVAPAPARIRKLFDPRLIEEAFLTEECAFDATRLRETMVRRVRGAGVETWLGAEVVRLGERKGGGIEVQVRAEQREHRLQVRNLFNCGYSGINRPLWAAGISPVPLKHELTELCLVRVPQELRGLGVTLMCGPFFSLMPFPPEELHTLSHVRYTPHFEWRDEPRRYHDGDVVLERCGRTSAYPYMIRDARRYLPALEGCTYLSSIWEVKTVLPRSEVDDSRPILFKPHYGVPNHHLILGGKIDNVYDVVERLDALWPVAAG